MLGLHNAQSAVSRTALYCIGFRSAEFCNRTIAANRGVQRSLRIVLISTQGPTKLSDLDHGFSSALNESSSARPNTLALSTRALSFNSCIA